MSTPYSSVVQAAPGFNANNNIIAGSLFNQATGSGNGQIDFDGDKTVTFPGQQDPNWAYGNTNDSMRASIIDYIRMRLADGIVDVELEKEHYEMGINQAMIKYRQRAQNAVEESYCTLTLLPETQEYILPKEIQSVRQVFRRGIGSVTGTTASQFEPFASGYLNTYMLVAGRVGGLTNYEMFSSYQKLAMTMFGGFMNFTFDPVTKRLVLVRKMPWQGANPDPTQQESVLLWIFNTRPDSMILNSPQSFPWIQDYAYSFCKFILGEAREKFSQIAGPQGGATLNGASLKSEAKEEMQKLEEDLNLYVDGSQPLTWLMG
jgi:hypothetical protein